MILGDSGQRVANEPYVPMLQVRQAAEVIEDFAAYWIGKKRVDGEVAPRRIFTPVLREGHRGTTPVSGNVAAQRRNLHDMATADRSDCAVIDPGWHCLDFCLPEPAQDRLRVEPRSEVHVGVRDAEQLVANGPADEACQALFGTQHGQQLAHAELLLPFCDVELQLHCSLRDKFTIIAAVAPQILRSLHMIS